MFEDRGRAPILRVEVIMAVTTAKFRVDPLLIKVLSETYRSTEKALKELVDNAWDADAGTVRISLPAPMSGDSIVVADDGSGMTTTEVEGEYLIVADDRRSRRGERTPNRKRQVKGRKGIGKFAGLMAADTMSMETMARGQRTRLRIRKEALKPREGDLEAVSLPKEVSACPMDTHGTTITLSDLNQAFDYPDADKLRRLLFLEYGRCEDFTIFVNGCRLDMSDLPGKAIEHREEVPQIGAVELRYTVGDGKQGFKGSGIALRIQGKIVGEPTFFGLDEDPEVPPALLKKVYGEVQADGLIDGVTADWGAVIENSTGYSTLKDKVAGHVKGSLREVHKRDMNLARARLQKEIDAELAKLPEHRRRIAERYLSKVLAKFYNEPEERLKVIVNLCLEALEVDDYYAVFEKLQEAEKGDVAVFADALQEFGLLDMTLVARQARRRSKFLDYLDELATNPKTTEKELHQAIAENLWVLGPQYGFVSSNSTLAKMLEREVGAKFTGPRTNKRPDLFLAQRMPDCFLLIEFKHPAKAIDRDAENQAVKYRDDLIRYYQPIHILMLGSGRAATVDPRTGPPDLVVVSYVSLISTARTQLETLLRELRDSRLPPLPVGAEVTASA